MLAIHILRFEGSSNTYMLVPALMLGNVRVACLLALTEH
jgi:hypothetical protein